MTGVRVERPDVGRLTGLDEADIGDWVLSGTCRLGLTHLVTLLDGLMLDVAVESRLCFPVKISPLDRREGQRAETSVRGFG